MAENRCRLSTVADALYRDRRECNTPNLLEGKSKYFPNKSYEYSPVKTDFSAAILYTLCTLFLGHGTRYRADHREIYFHQRGGQRRFLLLVVSVEDRVGVNDQMRAFCKRHCEAGLWELHLYPDGTINATDTDKNQRPCTAVSHGWGALGARFPHGSNKAKTSKSLVGE